MATPLKDSYGPEVPERIAGMVRRVHPAFPVEAFLGDALDGFDALELTPRARHVAAVLARHLPADYRSAVGILVASLGPPLGDPDAESGGMDAFVYLPHVFYVAEHGLAHFDASMDAQHAITQRFTCEYGIRPFIEREPERTLAVLARWTRDPSPHVRRLVSEGTRPRLPWAPRLRAFVADPAPVVPLLEALRDDPSEYVRRSVANNLNDISKDHPGLVVELATRWMDDAPPERRRLVRHALRTLLKAGDPAALAALGLDAAGPVVVRGLRVEPSPARIGGRAAVVLEVVNEGAAPVRSLVHLRVHFVTARGGTSPRVFVVREATLAPGERAELRKTISLRQHTTRTHHPGEHRIEVVVNGREGAEATVQVLPEVSSADAT
jgi:3-methyladenine DNA glycosylase AlkC